MKCIYLGYSIGLNGYQIWCLRKGKTPKFVISRDVTFDESAMCNQRRESKTLARKHDHGAS